MALMALDHTRDFFLNISYSATDIDQASTGLFFTRWITHFCAPIFIFLAGTGACLSLTRGKTTKDLARFLFTRGLWMIFLECTVIRFGWRFDLTYASTELQVFWAIGWSMITLAALIWLPLTAVALYGVAATGLHNLLDPIAASDFGDHAWLWHVLHVPGHLFDLPNFKVFTIYPLIPWTGLMALGFVFGSWWKKWPKERIKICLGLGISLLMLFVSLRVGNIYGDPAPWSPQETRIKTFLSFINVGKYPPSLDYLLVTIGISLLLLAAMEKRPATIRNPLVIFGRVPLFYYVAHIYLIHALAVGAASVWLHEFTMIRPFEPFPGNFGLPLEHVYMMWLAVLILLFPLCRWYANFKARQKHWIYSYL